MKKRLFLLAAGLSLAFGGFAHAELRDSAVMRMMRYASAVNGFGKAVPQEKVYLHFDNTSYYRGDRIWFACYVVTAPDNRPSNLSKTLYVELLDPEGAIVGRRILPVADGRCHGDFPLTRLPFRSGFYEVRAYTKYMLNFGESTIFSRVLPVFDSPRLDGDYGERRMLRYGRGRLSGKRRVLGREGRVSVKFYPEGGNAVEGLTSCVAFEAVDAQGLPLDVEGRVVGRDGEVRARFSSEHDGRGAFEYLPAEGDRAEVEADGKSYSFDLPEARPQGVVLRVDNLSSADSVTIAVRKNAATPPTVLGAAVMCGGRLSSFSLLDIEDDDEVRFSVARNSLSAGVARIVLADTAGRTVADRLIFSREGGRAGIGAEFDREEYGPYGEVRAVVSLHDAAGNALRDPVSVAVRDCGDEVEGGGTILTDLLLMSEIRGYVRRPSYYFEADDAVRRRDLDHLLMVQGWRRYDWDVWSGAEPFDLKYLPEQGIEVNGQVVHYSTRRPLTDINLSSILMKRGEENAADSLRTIMHVGVLEVDSMGRFSFSGNFRGKWSLALSVTNSRDRRKWSRILIDRAFSPSPRSYRQADMQVFAVGDALCPADDAASTAADTVKAWEEYDTQRGGIDERVHRIERVVVKGTRMSDEERVFRNRSTAASYYDIPSEIDSLRDGGELVDDIFELLAEMDDNFFIRRASMDFASVSQRDSADSSSVEQPDISGEWRITYKNKTPLFVVNHKPSWETLLKADLLRLGAVKSVYVNEDLSVICDYAERDLSPMDAISKYGCVVFVETFPENEVRVDAGRGVRKTWVDGYDDPAEFYMPDYSVLPKEEDYRRTLYWNPALVPDGDGRAEISFYNNGRCRRMRISAETVTSAGATGVLDKVVGE